MSLCRWVTRLAASSIPHTMRSALARLVSGISNIHNLQGPCVHMILAPGHTEAVQMLFNPAVVSYKELLTVLFDRMDPTTLNR